MSNTQAIIFFAFAVFVLWYRLEKMANDIKITKDKVNDIHQKVTLSNDDDDYFVE